MAKPRHLRMAPIAEALLDLRAQVPPGFRVERLAEAGKRLGERFSTAEVQTQMGGLFCLDPRAGIHPVPERTGVRGYAFKSIDGLEVVQFRVDGFTFNRLRPYTNWDDVSSKARDYWRVFVEVASPIAVSRCAVRTINHLRLPFPIKYEEYLTAPPCTPPGLPEELLEFLTRFTLRENTGNAVTITQGLQPSRRVGEGLVVLDIDAFRPAAAEANSAEVWDIMDSLRVFKDRVFFASITEKTARLYA